MNFQFKFLWKLPIHERQVTISPVTADHIRTSISRDLSFELLEKLKTRYPTVDTYCYFSCGERNVFLLCRWGMRSRELCLTSYQRITLDEYLDHLLELRAERRKKIPD